MNQTVVHQDAGIMDQMRAAGAALMATASLSGKRLGRDLVKLMNMVAGPWADSVSILGLSPLDPGFAIHVELVAPGLVWCGDHPGPQAAWRLALRIFDTYPLATPEARLQPPYPYNPHVCHPDFLPDVTGLPARLQHYLNSLRDGSEGMPCCYVSSHQWNTSVDCDLCRILFMISRLLTGERFHGERAALNAAALVEYLRLDQAGSLPLGRPLPFPHDPGAPSPGDAAEDQDDEDVEWLPAQEHEVQS